MRHSWGIMPLLVAAIVFCSMVLAPQVGQMLRAQGSDTTAAIQPTDATPGQVAAPEGFNKLYSLIFAAGMVLHWLKKVKDVTGGWARLLNTDVLKSLPSLFAGWFINQFHLTLIAGAAVAIATLAAKYELNVDLTHINALSAAVAVLAGYTADSMFNGGDLGAKLVKVSGNVSATS